MEPRTPFSFATAPVGRRPLDVNDYVAEMVRVYESTHDFVRRFKQERVDVREGQVARRNRTTKANVGDFMLVVRPQFLGQKTCPGEVSKKLLHRTYDEVFQVANMVSDAAVVLKKLDGTDPTDFSNPINLERCIPAHTWTVTEPEGGSLKLLDLLQDDEVTWRRARVVGYGYGGIVKVKYDDQGNDDETWIDLTKEHYRWVV